MAQCKLAFAMKIVSPALLAVALASMLLSRASASTVIFSEDFESYAAGANLSTNAKWGSVSANAPNFLTVKEDTGNIFGLGTANRYLDASDTSPVELTRMDAKPSSPFQFATLEMDIYEPANISGTYWGVAVANAFSAQFNGGGIRTTGAGAYIPGLYTVDAEHHLSITFNNTASTQTYDGGNSVASRTFDLWIDGVLVIDNAAFTGAVAAGTDLASFNLTTSSGSYSQEMYVDNIVLTTIPEPSSVGLAVISFLGTFWLCRKSRGIARRA